jgi:hypothetical protein
MPAIDMRPRRQHDANSATHSSPANADEVWFEQVEASPQYSLRFHSKGRGPVHTLVPLNQIMDERYSVYLRHIDTI